MVARWMLVLVLVTGLVFSLHLAPQWVRAQDDKVTWNLPTDYSGVQGENNWYYYRVEDDQYTPLAYDDTVSPWPRKEQPCWNATQGEGSPRYLEIDGLPEPFMQTGERADTAIGWQAPRAGTVTATGIMTATSTSEEYKSWCGPQCDDGIRFSILKGTEVQDGPVRILHGDPEDQWHTLTATFRVEEGDFIYFLQERGRWQDADAAWYDFTVSYSQSNPSGW